MAEELTIDNKLSKEEKYQSLLPQIRALIESESDEIANLANAASALRYGMGFFWVGFYLVKDDQLILGPFQGTVACTRISRGKGVCGTAWDKDETIIVEDVDEFPGHIACSAESKSEIVLPIHKGNRVYAVLDIDSNIVGDFDEIDAKYLKELCHIIEGTFLGS